MSSHGAGPGKQRVLIVEDDPAVLAIHARLVDSLGYDVETAADGLEGLTKLALGIDLVLLDLNMPSMDGFEVAARIRRHPTYGRLPIIVTTGSDKESWFARALEVGANDVLAKPINADELRLRMHCLMELKAMRDEASATKEELKKLGEQAARSLRRALEKSAESERRARQAELETVRRLTVAAEYKDETIAGHLERVGRSAEVLANAAGLPGSTAEMIRHAAALHDVGMIGIPDAVLLKAGPLDNVELALVQEHTRIGASLLEGSDSEVIRMGANIALCHHEH
jgi:putative two-component system response regulator